jgi:hypothetical protein
MGPGGTGTGATGAAQPEEGIFAQGAGLCSCSLPGTSRTDALPIGLGVAGLGLLAGRRRARRSR